MTMFAVYQPEQLVAMEATGPLTAWAVFRPCQLYTDHGSARPSVVHGHHLRPEYLQRRKYGRTIHHELTWLCGSCHDNVHAELYWRMGERRRPLPEVPLRARILAAQALAWYLDPAA